MLLLEYNKMRSVCSDFNLKPSVYNSSSFFFDNQVYNSSSLYIQENILSVAVINY